MTGAQHFVNISGGKDSTAVYLLALRRGRPFRAVMADTGHEHPETIAYAERLSERTGGPAVEMVRADFSAEIARKRRYVETVWRAEGVPEATVERALAALVPTGVPMLDLCLWKGRFPSRKAQFCTEFLKERAVFGACIGPALREGVVVQWLGVRRNESANRARAPFAQRIRFDDRHDMLLFRPLIHWTAENVFAFARAHGLEPNPLYLQGMGRVGCFPCVNASKDELAAIGRRFPWAIDRLLGYEAAVMAASKRGIATFFAPDKTPEGAALSKRLKRRALADTRRELPDADPDGREFERVRSRRFVELAAAAPWPRAEEVFRWATTSRGGRQFDLLAWGSEDEGLSCSSQYGLCE
jgi:3'-phosphoadenosine 5'-phosphosulfate sulfotransferase (PAPS reductase)/FAD synthetase